MRSCSHMNDSFSSTWSNVIEHRRYLEKLPRSFGGTESYGCSERRDPISLPLAARGRSSMRASHKARLSVRSQSNRIRKLLLSEYCELSEKILVESPFAETTRDGRGLRQVALGLTATKLIVAADILRSNPGFFCPPGVDASIESFELVSVYPLEYVTFSVFRRRRRRTLKARYTPSTDET